MALSAFDWTILVLCIVSTLIFIVAMYLTISRRRCNVIRERTYLLVVISAFGILANILSTAFAALWLKRISVKAEWGGFYVGVVSEYVFFAPYLIRAIQIRVSFVDFVKSTDLYQKHLYRLQPRWYLSVLSIGFFLTCLFPCVFGIIGIWSPETPLTFSYTGHSARFYKQAIFNFIHFLQVFTLLVMIYRLRHVEEPYSMNKEMKIVCVLFFVVSAIDTPGVPFLEVSYLLLLLRDAAVLIVSILWPVLFIWNEHTDVQPTPENIRCLEFAFQHAETLAAFQRFLRSKRPDCEPSDSTSTSFSHEGEGFLWFLVELNKLEERPKWKYAMRLFRMFLDSGEPNFPSALVEEVRETLTTGNKEDEKTLIDAFSAVRCYATTILSNQYYPRFTASEQFRQLQEHVELLTKRWGQLTTAVA